MSSRLRHGRQLDRDVEPFVDARVELDVDRRDVLVPERVREGTADHEATPAIATSQSGS